MQRLKEQLVKKIYDNKQWKKQPKDGIEPSTFRLQGECSATKLFGLILGSLKHLFNLNALERYLDFF